MPGAATAKTKHDAYCPHCFLLVDNDVKGEWPEHPVRCPHCRLLIGPGRGRETADANPGARGSAAGVFAHQAKREDGDNVSKDDVREAIRKVAEELGSRPERLLMVDYQQQATGDDSLPTLSDVFSAFGSWKRARREAAV
jgi:HNH endonuclease